MYEFSPKVKTWEQGVKKVLMFAYEVIYEGITGNKIEDKRIKQSSVISVEEAHQLKKRLRAHPYDTPKLTNFLTDEYDITRIHYNAFKIDKEYECLSNEEIEELCDIVIEDFFADTRVVCPMFYIEVATPTVLRLAILLTNNAKIRLQDEMKEKEENLSKQATEEKEILEIEVDSFGESNE